MVKEAKEGEEVSETWNDFWDIELSYTTREIETNVKIWFNTPTGNKSMLSVNWY